MTALDTAHGRLWVRTFGPEPVGVVALHGFTLHGAMFSQLAEMTAQGLAAPDLPGHGQTTVSPITMRTAVDAVAELLQAQPAPPLLLGYSQGGRVALQVALTFPNLVGSLVLVATSPGLNDRARRLRRAADDGLAARIERIGTERFIAEWLANPLVATDHVAPDLRAADRAIRLENSASGLAAALRGMGQASVAESSSRIAALPMPVRFIAGRKDESYCAHATTLAALRGQDAILVEDAGHNVILEAPGAVADVVNGLLGATQQ